MFFVCAAEWRLKKGTVGYVTSKRLGFGTFQKRILNTVRRKRLLVPYKCAEEWSGSTPENPLPPSTNKLRISGDQLKQLLASGAGVQRKTRRDSEAVMRGRMKTAFCEKGIDPLLKGCKFNWFQIAGAGSNCRRDLIKRL